MAETKDTPDPDRPNQPQPGTVIAPGVAPPRPTPAAEPVPAPTEPAAPAPPANVPEANVPEAPEPPVEQPQPDEPAPLEEDAQPDDDDGQAVQSVTWTASEFVAHDKSTGWYISLLAGTLLLAALLFLLTRSFVTVAVVVISGLLLGIYGTHKPRQLEYRLDGRGVGIGQKYRGYDEFRSFSIVPEGAFGSIVFMPLKRFAVPTTVYYAPDDENKILAILTNQLPFEEHKGDAVDSLMRHIRF